MGQQFERASAWAQALPPRADPVIICRDLNSPKELLENLASRIEGAALAQGTVPMNPLGNAPRGPRPPGSQVEHGTTRRSGGARKQHLKQQAKAAIAAAEAAATDEASPENQAPPENEASQERDAQQNPSPFPADSTEVLVLGSAPALGTAVAAPVAGRPQHHRVHPVQAWSSPQPQHVPPATSPAASVSTTMQAAFRDAAHVSYSPRTPASTRVAQSAFFTSSPASSSGRTTTSNMSPYMAVGALPEFSPAATDATMHSSSSSSGALPMTPQLRRTPVNPKAWIKRRGRKSGTGSVEAELAETEAEIEADHADVEVEIEATTERRSVFSETPPDMLSQHPRPEDQAQVWREPHPPHVQAVMSTICSQQSPEQVLSMLQSALPERYDD